MLNQYWRLFLCLVLWRRNDEPTDYDKLGVLLLEIKGVDKRSQRALSDSIRRLDAACAFAGTFEWHVRLIILSLGQALRQQKHIDLKEQGSWFGVGAPPDFEIEIRDRALIRAMRQINVIIAMIEGR